MVLGVNVGRKRYLLYRLESWGKDELGGGCRLGLGRSSPILVGSFGCWGEGGYGVPIPEMDWGGGLLTIGYLFLDGSGKVLVTDDGCFEVLDPSILFNVTVSILEVGDSGVFWLNEFRAGREGAGFRVSVEPWDGQRRVPLLWRSLFWWRLRSSGSAAGGRSADLSGVFLFSEWKVWYSEGLVSLRWGQV